MIPLLKFSKSNGKLSNRLIFSIPAGYSCPHAGVCRTTADRTTGEVTDHPPGCSEARGYRCFAAMSEARFPTVRKSRWHNFDQLKAARNIYVDQHPGSPGNYYLAMKDLIMASLDAQPHRDMVRIHESGDFWHEHYMKAWMLVAKEHPQVKFYAYTKSLTMWYHLQDDINDNFYLTASHGGNEDSMLEKFPEVYKRIAYVVYTEEEAAALGLEVDHDDSHCFGDKPFALLVHGSQPAGSDASAAISQRKKDGSFVGYSSKK